jgi:Zn-finger nucleic acid-binding protein/ribosomal protein L40E
MRLIVQCDQCRRQYNATGKAPGKRFRCQCGTIVTVPRPEGHDASVVRCSSCAAPRQEQAAACPHCGSDFTLHERDLHTICPNCLARVSDRAKYCHHCAHLLTSESLRLASTDHACPMCGDARHLTSRELMAGMPQVLECSACMGIWLSVDAMEHLLDLEARREPGRRMINGAEQLVAEPPPQSGPAYRPCAVCKSLMMRRNFGQGESNVIVDICRVHGVWFDANELAALIRWIRVGGLTAAQAEIKRLRRDRLQRQRDARVSNVPNDSYGGGLPISDSNWQGESIAGVAVETILRLFDI